MELRNYDRLEKSIIKFYELKNDNAIEWIEDRMVWFGAGEGREGYVQVWCDGRKYATITPQIRKRDFPNITADFYGNQERKRQNRIAIEHMIKSSRQGVGVIGLEFSIPEKWTQSIKNSEINMKKKPEVDFLIVDVRDAKKPIIYLTEYKCSFRAAHSSAPHKNDIIGHGSDMSIMKRYFADVIKSASNVSYKLYCEYASGLNADSGKIDSEVNFTNAEIRIAFLFTHIACQASLKQKKVIMEDLKSLGDEDIVVWNFEDEDSVDFSVSPIEKTLFHF